MDATIICQVIFSCSFLVKADRRPIDEVADVHHTRDVVGVRDSLQEVDICLTHAWAMRIADDQNSGHPSSAATWASCEGLPVRGRLS